MDILESLDKVKSRLGAMFSPLENIIINSQYRVIAFSGRANGTFLNQNFLFNAIDKKRMLIKSIRLIPYAFVQTDVLWNSTTGDQFSVPPLARIPTVIDTFTTSPRITIEINGTRQDIFPSVTPGAYTMDLFVDNIYSNYKSKVSTLNVSVLGDVFVDLPTGTPGAPTIKVLIECYSY